MAKAGKILQLKIVLRRTKPPIWRRILIRDNITFEELHLAIQASMGWYNSHLYEFALGRGTSIGIPFEDTDDYILDAKKIKINKYLNRKGDRMIYNYDFGDNWEHLLTVEKVESTSVSEKYPVCIKGKGNCPPEDCGGVWGYYELLEVIKDPKHPDHEDMLEWLGKDYDLDGFSLEEINDRLKSFQRG